MKKTDLEIFANDCIADIRKGMLDTKTNASGKTSKGLFSVVSDYSIEIYSDRRGFANVEAGQNPGKRPRNFRDIIKQWILDKGLSIAAMPYKQTYINMMGRNAKTLKFRTEHERGLHYAASAIAWSNKTKGSRLYKKGGRNDVFSPAIERLVNRVADAAAQDLSLKIDAIFISTKL